MKTKSLTPDMTFEKAVARLGEMTPKQLAETIRANHITGRPHTSYACPMAKLLDIQCGVSTKVIGVGKKFIIRQYPSANSRHIRVATPPSVARFLVDFDLGKYPDLFAPPPRAIKASVNRDKRGGDRHKAGYVPKRRAIKVRRNLVGMLGGRGQLVNQYLEAR